jgi:ubiquinone/menaquinone biosynthesis C-methylase UbiE
MPFIDENKKEWDGDYQWTDRGDEWSNAWGGPSMQWYGSILPRIHRFLPTENILEIACGYGRWTQFLKNMCRNLEVIELSEKCLQACRQRFSDCSHIEYHLNDGKSLHMIADSSVNFVFSFDSLVHADESVLEAYISQLPRILKDEGAAFIHHSNLGEYRALYSRIRRIHKLEGLLVRLGVLEKTLHWRDFGVTATVVENLAEEHELKCISQEVVPWGTKRSYVDCFSTIVKANSSSARNNRIWRNPNLMQEAGYLSRLSALYADL